jgi:ABC-type Mn2+/Zn2+ transport system permease subunit
MSEFFAYYLGGSGTAVLACVFFVSLASGVVSPIVVANRMAFFSDAVAHSSLAGVALGMLLGVGHPVLSMVAFGVCVSLLIATLRQKSPLALDTVLGVAMAGSLAIGLVLYHYVRGYADLHSFLLGQVSLLGWEDSGFLASPRASTCACFRSPTGPSSTSGNTSARKASPCRRSISPTSVKWWSETGCSRR